jgi:hypothetical protein
MEAFTQIAPPIPEVTFAACLGCGQMKALSDVFDGTLCEACRIAKGLLRPDDALLETVAA